MPNQDVRRTVLALALALFCSAACAEPYAEPGAVAPKEAVAYVENVRQSIIADINDEAAIRDELAHISIGVQSGRFYVGGTVDTKEHKDRIIAIAEMHAGKGKVRDEMKLPPLE